MDAVKNLVRKHWDRRAADFDKETSHGLLNDTQASAWRRLISRVAGHRPLDVLDVGCGTGFLSLLLAAQGHRVTGADIALSMLERARAKAAAQGLTIRFVMADVETLDSIPDASYDLIVERHVLWTLPHPNTALDTWRRILRERGRVAMIEGWWTEMEPREEYVEIQDRLPLFGGRPKDEIIAMAQAQGFEKVTTEALMDDELWTEKPRHPRYIVIARNRAN